MKIEKAIKDLTLCYHCGEECTNSKITIDQKHFCCHGCKTVYELLSEADLCTYYSLNEKPGLSQKKETRKNKFDFLNDPKTEQKLLQFKDNKTARVTFYLPIMHCSSCVWLLEHLYKLNKAIIKSEVNFLKKEITVTYHHKAAGLNTIAALLSAIGYEPHISLNDISEKTTSYFNKARILKIGIAGFCFGNIMMLSFPDYFSLGNIEEKGLKNLFSFLNLGLSLPVFFYCASEFFVSAYHGLRQKFLNIDAPIALAIVITFVRSTYEILSRTGVGYLDSMSGIVFFMLLGRYFQDKTYNTLTFTRDYRSFFPLGITVISDGGNEEQIPVAQLKKGQRIKVHAHEIVPADSILFMGKARIDYGFVTGESLPHEIQIGEIIYAGGKQTLASIELEVVKDVSHSYLTQLWNNDQFKKDKIQNNESVIHKISLYFTLVLFLIAGGSAIYWALNDSSKILNAVTAILIVACPCALLLSATFTNGSIINTLSRFGFYARNAQVLERIVHCGHLVFDKTGTLTRQEESKLFFEGPELDRQTQQLIRTLANQSMHPLSKAIVAALPFQRSLKVSDYKEVPGSGISGKINLMRVKIGSADFILEKKQIRSDGSKVYISINEEVIGCYCVRSRFRQGIFDLTKRLGQRFKLSILSGDNDSQKKFLYDSIPGIQNLLFEQKPETKMTFISNLQKKGEKVIMIGDGLNDAGALKQSDVGIAVTDDQNNFTPASDVILKGSALIKLDRLLNYAAKGKIIIAACFIVSILYNVVGLYYAAQARLEPVIAAVLMPLSTFSILIISTGLSKLFSKPLHKELENYENQP